MRNPTCEHCGQDVPFEDFDYLAEQPVYSDEGVYIIHAHCVSRMEVLANRMTILEQRHGLCLVDTMGLKNE